MSFVHLVVKKKPQAGRESARGFTKNLGKVILEVRNNKMVTVYQTLHAKQPSFSQKLTGVRPRNQRTSERS
jgi:hypothetical protein